MPGSVEKLDYHKNKHIVGERQQVEVSALTPVGTAVDVRRLAAFDHRHDGFDLGPLTISGAVETDLYQPPVTAGGGFGRGAAVLGRDDRADLMLLTRKPMVRFGVVAGVGGHLRDVGPLQAIGHQRAELVDIGPRTTTGLVGVKEVIVAARHHAQLGIMMINHGFQGVPARLRRRTK